MTLQFCGAAREVTGSAHLLTLDDGYKILLDCGLYQGRNDEMEDFNENFLFPPAEVDCLVLSHAHIDHTGRVPGLYKQGFRGPIYATHATRSLCAIMLLDSAYIQERDAEYYNKKHQSGPQRTPLYTTEDVKPTMDNFVGLPYDEWHRLREGVEIQYRDAGHILGSANVTLRIQTDRGERIIGFSGDIGRPDRPILRDPRRMPECDYMICESTYGDRLHEAKPAETEKFLNVIRHTCVNKKGKLLIPAFSVGRTQEIVYMLDQMESSGQLPRVPVFVDSPLAVNATTIFGTHPECYDGDLNEYLLRDDDPFGFRNLTYIKKAAKSKELNQLDGPAIIISSSGMMNAGRSKHHLRNLIGSGNNTILIVGYCAPYTPGGKLRDGVEGMKLYGEYHEVKAEVVLLEGFSAHGDQAEMIDFLQGQQRRNKELFLVHGTLDRMEIFRDKLQGVGFKKIRMPELGEVVELE